MLPADQQHSWGLGSPLHLQTMELSRSLSNGRCDKIEADKYKLSFGRNTERCYANSVEINQGVLDFLESSLISGKRKGNQVWASCPWEAPSCPRQTRCSLAQPHCFSLFAHQRLIIVLWVSSLADGMQIEFCVKLDAPHSLLMVFCGSQSTFARAQSQPVLLRQVFLLG